MKRNASYIILSIIIILCIFITAATCNFCGIQLDTGPSEETEEKPVFVEDETARLETQERAQTDNQTTEIEQAESVAEDVAGEGSVEEEAAVEESEEEVADFVTYDITIEADRTLSGHVVEGLAGANTGFCIVGDDTNNKQIKGYLSFNISDLEGITVLNARLNFNNLIISENPEEISELLNIKAYDYDDSLDLSDFAVGGTDIITLNITGIEDGGNIVVSENDALKNTLQDSINEGENWYQLKLGLKGTTDNHNDWDNIYFETFDALLLIHYSE